MGRDQARGRYAPGLDDDEPIGAPGRRTLTMALPARPVQRKDARAPSGAREVDLGVGRGDAGGGLPAELRTGVEALSGLAMDDVRVHRGSSQPMAVGAAAFAQGSDIHLGPGQDHHLAHEAWHVVQQKQGRVAATMQAAHGFGINDDAALEREADEMGARALAIGVGGGDAAPAVRAAAPGGVAQLAPLGDIEHVRSSSYVAVLVNTFAATPSLYNLLNPAVNKLVGKAAELQNLLFRAVNTVDRTENVDADWVKAIMTALVASGVVTNLGNQGVNAVLTSLVSTLQDGKPGARQPNGKPLRAGPFMWEDKQTLADAIGDDSFVDVPFKLDDPANVIQIERQLDNAQRAPDQFVVNPTEGGPITYRLRSAVRTDGNHDETHYVGYVDRGGPQAREWHENDDVGPRKRPVADLGNVEADPTLIEARKKRLGGVSAEAMEEKEGPYYKHLHPKPTDVMASAVMYVYEREGIQREALTTPDVPHVGNDKTADPTRFRKEYDETFTAKHGSVTDPTSTLKDDVLSLPKKKKAPNLSLPKDKASPKAQQPATWDTLASGKHSFQELDPAMYVTCQMQPVPESEAELVFFNFKLAEQLGLAMPRTSSGIDEAALARLVIRTFAWRTAPSSGQVEHDGKKMIATRYQDSKGRTDTDAKGDGRVVWSGEVVGPNTLDVQIKGVGTTSLEWTGHSHQTHRDGLQSLGEGVHSFMISLLNEANGIESTRDLALIKLKNVVKDDEERGTKEPATITVRIGSQLRMGHLEYWHDDAQRSTKMTKYAIRRSLGLDDEPTAEDLKRYLRRYAERSGRDAATQYHLHSFHGTMTRGNRTTEGTPIDNGTWNYLDASHGQYTAGPMKYAQQGSEIRNNISTLIEQLDIKSIDPELDDYRDALTNSCEKAYRDAFDQKLQELMLGRLGYQDQDLPRIAEAAQQDGQGKLVTDYTKAMRDVYDAEATGEQKVMGKDIAPAQFNARRMLLGIVRFVGQFGDRAAPWHTPEGKQDRDTAIAEFDKATAAKYMEGHAKAQDVPAWETTFAKSTWETDAATLCSSPSHDVQCQKLIALADAVYALTRYLYGKGIKMEPRLIERRNQPRPEHAKARDVLWDAFQQQVETSGSLADRNQAIMKVGAPYVDQ